MVKNYIYIAKPGIVLSNLLTGLAGLYLATNGVIDNKLYSYTLIGLLCILASSTTLNNYIDRDIDTIMSRTHNRITALGKISTMNLLLYSIILGVLGLIILYITTNKITVTIALMGYIVYVCIYSLWLKRTSVHSTLVGSIAGAVPPLIGYTAYSNTVDTQGIWLFALLTIWQIPHSYAIGIYRLKDYVAVNIPILPVKKGIYNTKIHILVWTICFFIINIVPFIVGFGGYIYLIVMSLASVVWIILCLRGFKTADDTRWAKGIFLYSILIIVLFCVTIVVDL